MLAHIAVTLSVIMKYSSHIVIKSYILFFTVTSGSCWQFFTSLVDLVLDNSLKDVEHMHSDYNFGDCKRVNQIFYTHVHLDHMDVLGKLIVRGWLDLKRIPTCIILRGTSYSYDLFRSTAYNFQICVPRITYCHTHKRYKYYYYEWYLPMDVIGGMNWEIYFYGPPNVEWQ